MHQSQVALAERPISKELVLSTCQVFPFVVQLEKSHKHRSDRNYL